MSMIYKFASAGPSGLFAFAGDQTGSRLPDQHGPWKPDGVIEARQAIPRFERAVIEKAISEHGYQMWRVKKDRAGDTAARRPARRDT